MHRYAVLALVVCWVFWPAFGWAQPESRPGPEHASSDIEEWPAACDAGDDEACVELGMLYARGLLAPDGSDAARDDSRATGIEMLESSCGRGHPRACRLGASVCELTPTFSLEACRDMVTTACDQGDELACAVPLSGLDESQLVALARLEPAIAELNGMFHEVGEAVVALPDEPPDSDQLVRLRQSVEAVLVADQQVWAEVGALVGPGAPSQPVSVGADCEAVTLGIERPARTHSRSESRDASDREPELDSSLGESTASNSGSEETRVDPGFGEGPGPDLDSEETPAEPGLGEGTGSGLTSDAESEPESGEGTGLPAVMGSGVESEEEVSEPVSVPEPEMLSDAAYLELLSTVGRCLEFRRSTVSRVLEGTAAERYWGLPQLPEAVRLLVLAGAPADDGEAPSEPAENLTLSEMMTRTQAELEREAVPTYQTPAELLRDARWVHGEQGLIRDLPAPGAGE